MLQKIAGDFLLFMVYYNTANLDHKQKGMFPRPLDSVYNLFIFILHNSEFISVLNNNIFHCLVRNKAVYFICNLFCFEAYIYCSVSEHISYCFYSVEFRRLRRCNYAERLSN